ncbi:hypothetical protein CRG98_032371, partial [Punica granatum]
MDSTSALSLHSHPKITPAAAPRYNSTLQFGLCSAAASLRSSRRRLRCRRLVVVAASGSGGGSRRVAGKRRVYQESQSESSLSAASVKQIASSVAPAAAFVAATFVLWKLVEKLLMPKRATTSTAESKSPAQGMKWSIGAGSNLLSNLNAKIDRQSKQKINEFAKELRTFSVVDMS